MSNPAEAVPIVVGGNRAARRRDDGGVDLLVPGEIGQPRWVLAMSFTAIEWCQVVAGVSFYADELHGFSLALNSIKHLHLGRHG